MLAAIGGGRPTLTTAFDCLAGFFSVPLNVAVGNWDLREAYGQDGSIFKRILSLGRFFYRNVAEDAETAPGLAID